jgi:hypothetical protein
VPYISPAEVSCPDCGGCGFDMDGATCPRCDRIGKTWAEGGPSFGCRMTLEDCEPGQIVILGTGHRGRIVRHTENGTPATEIAIIGDFTQVEESQTTWFPTVVGVQSASLGSWAKRDKHGDARAKEDHMDPLQRGRGT